MLSKYFRLPFASSGDKTSIPDATQTAGDVSYQQGYGPDYQRDKTSDPLAKTIERDKMNALFNDMTNALKVLQEFGGAVEWIAPADNGGNAFAYDYGARVRYSGQIYISLVDNNTDTPVGPNWLKWNLSDYMTPVGTVIGMAQTSVVDPGWLVCNGALVSRASFHALFARIGTTFGAGDGFSSFNLPDFRGVFLRGWDNSRGIDPGRAFGSSQADDFKAHTHYPLNIAGLAEVPDTGLTVGEKTADGYPSFGAGLMSTTGGTETRPRNIAIDYWIKY